eukprot:1158174-Pelagomonas_calceolata.AAC.6
MPSIQMILFHIIAANLRPCCSTPDIAVCNQYYPPLTLLALNVLFPAVKARAAAQGKVQVGCLRPLIFKPS